MNPYTQLPRLSRRVDGQVNWGVTASNDPLDEMVSVYSYKSIDAIGNLFGRAIDVARAWQRRRRAISELTALGDRTLQDIGLHRSEIRSVVEELLESESRSRVKSTHPAEKPISATPRNARREAVNDNSMKTAA